MTRPRSAECCPLCMVPLRSLPYRGGRRVIRCPRRAEHSPHGSSEHEADAGSRAARGPPPATGRRCAYSTAPWGREQSSHCVSRWPRSAETCLPGSEELKAEHDAGS